jgi:CheY-like chemotaxis protein
MTPRFGSSPQTLYGISGFQVHEAAHAAEAIGIFQRGTIFDLVFTDIRMPGDLDGLGLVAWIRRYYPELPVMLTSAHSLRLDAVPHLRSEERFIAKPADPFLIAEEIKSVLEEHRRSQH